MREIKFRAKRIEDGKWVFGHYYEYDGNSLTEHYITDGERKWMVDPLTRGEFVGLNDKEKVEIYEGDLFKPDDLVKPHCLEVKYGDNGSFEPFGNSEYSNSPKYGEVIGNIYENKELLDNRD